MIRGLYRDDQIDSIITRSLERKGFSFLNVGHPEFLPSGLTRNAIATSRILVKANTWMPEIYQGTPSDEEMTKAKTRVRNIAIEDFVRDEDGNTSVVFPSLTNNGRYFSMAAVGEIIYPELQKLRQIILQRGKDDIFPLKILFPYNLGGTVHWNAGEIILYKNQDNSFDVTAHAYDPYGTVKTAYYPTQTERNDLGLTSIANAFIEGFSRSGLVQSGQKIRTQYLDPKPEIDVVQHDRETCGGYSAEGVINLVDHSYVGVWQSVSEDDKRPGGVSLRRKHAEILGLAHHREDLGEEGFGVISEESLAVDDESEEYEDDESQDIVFSAENEEYLEDDILALMKSAASDNQSRIYASEVAVDAAFLTCADEELAAESKLQVAFEIERYFEEHGEKSKDLPFTVLLPYHTGGEKDGHWTLLALQVDRGQKLGTKKCKIYFFDSLLSSETEKQKNAEILRGALATYYEVDPQSEYYHPMFQNAQAWYSEDVAEDAMQIALARSMQDTSTTNCGAYVVANARSALKGGLGAICHTENMEELDAGNVLARGADLIQIDRAILLSLHQNTAEEDVGFEVSSEDPNYDDRGSILPRADSMIAQQETHSFDSERGAIPPLTLQLPVIKEVDSRNTSLSGNNNKLSRDGSETPSFSDLGTLSRTSSGGSFLPPIHKKASQAPSKKLGKIWEEDGVTKLNIKNPLPSTSVAVVTAVLMKVPTVKNSAFHGKDRGDDYKTIEGAYSEDKSERAKEVAEIMAFILSKIAYDRTVKEWNGDKELTKEQLLALIDYAKKNGGVGTKINEGPDAETFPYVEQTNAEIEEALKSSGVKVSVKVAKRVSGQYQAQCRSCGILSGHEDSNEGSTLNFLTEQAREIFANAVEINDRIEPKLGENTPQAKKFIGYDRQTVEPFYVQKVIKQKIEQVAELTGRTR